MKVYFNNEDEIKKFNKISHVKFLKSFGDVYCEKTLYNVRFSFNADWRYFNPTESIDEVMEHVKSVLDERTSVIVEINKYDDYVKI